MKKEIKKIHIFQIKKLKNLNKKIRNSKERYRNEEIEK